MTTSIAVTQGDDRFDNACRALNLIADQVDLRDRRQVLIKPNLVSTVNQLAATHVDAVRATLEFVRASYDGPMCIAEGAALSPTFDGYERFGYVDVAREYDVQLIDINASETIPVKAFDRRLRPITLRLARPVVESDFRISVNPPKTHDTVIVTLSIKNMVLGSLINPALARSASVSVEPMIHPTSRQGQPTAGIFNQVMNLAKMALPGSNHSDKLSMHQGSALININIARLAPYVLPHLTVIDGFEGMEGNGPNNGDPVAWRVALAGIDSVAVDHLTAYLMGFDPAQIGYLSYCRQLGLGDGDIHQIELLGGLTLDDVRHPFKPHPTTARQSAWQLDNAVHWLRAA